MSRKTKHPLKSRSMVSAYMVIIVGLLQYFGIIGADQNVDITIDEPAKTTENQVVGGGLIAAGYVGLKGRKGAKTNVGDLI